MLVRGSPGSGKSALLGVCVCAAHPRLRAATASLWQVAAHRPSLHPNLAAVHARQYDLREITASLGRQLLDGDGARDPASDTYPGHQTFPAAPRSPEDLVDALAQLPDPPVVVLDALDEALGPEGLIDRLLLPLVTTRRSDGRPICRLLVGTRPWSRFGRLLEYADQHGEVVDLDDIPPSQRRTDLTAYVDALLELHTELALAATAGPRRAFARAVADTLTHGGTASGKPPALSGVLERVLPGSDNVDQTDHWGETLVAALYTYQATRHDSAAFNSSEVARELGELVPTTLPEVLELDLAQRPPSPWRRALLAGLAHAGGEGMPLTLLTTVTTVTTVTTTLAAVFNDTALGAGGPGVTLDAEQVSAELGRLRFYLRTGVDTDGTTLYRLFHQGLADYLQRLSGFTGFRDPRDQATFAGRRITRLVFDSLIHTVPRDGDARRWDLAVPYLLRHLARHANDAGRVDALLTEAGFLVYADQDSIRPVTELATSDAARVAATVYRTALSSGTSTRDHEARGDCLAITATQFAASALRGDLPLITVGAA